MFFNPRDEETARMVSHYLGEEEVLLETRSRSYGRNGSSSQSEQYHKRPLLTVEQLLKFDQGECVVINPGYKGSGEASVPLRTKIKLPKQDDVTQRRSEELWKLVQQRLEKRTSSHSQDHQALREALQIRRALAERLFPLPFKETEDEFDTDTSPEPSFDSRTDPPNVNVPAPINISAPAITDDLKEFV